MLRKIAIVAVFAAMGFAVSGCDTMDEGQSESLLAYNACRQTYMDKRASLSPRWAFISGVDDDGGTGCYSAHGYAAGGAAAKAALDVCLKNYARCWIFATSDGLSDWVKQVSANLAAGRDPDWRPGDRNARNSDDSGGDTDTAHNSDSSGGGSSIGDFVGGLTDFLNAAAGIGSAMNGGGGSAGGGGGAGGGYPSLPASNGYSQRGAFDDCAKLFDALGPAAAAQKAECERRAANMGTAQ